jgi:hypothetical protein
VMVDKRLYSHVDHCLSHLQLVCTCYFGILESRIPLTVNITSNMCFNVEFMLCRWISFPVLSPVLPEGVAQCEGFGRPSWITKCVTLTNESGVDVARGICHYVNADLVIDSDGMPLGNDRVAVQIAESLVEDEVSYEWMFSMKAWHIRRVFLNGASLYDHDQRHIYNAAV